MEYPIDFPGSLIGGQYQNFDNGEQGEINIANPSLPSQKIISFEYFSDQVDAAVSEAKRSLVEWSFISPQKRVESLMGLKRVFESHKNEFISVLIHENGRPEWEAEIEWNETMQIFGCLGSFIKEVYGQNNNTDDNNSGIIRKPLGTIAVLTTYSQPLYEPVNYVISALVAGNTVVLKPSTHTSGMGVLIAKCFKESNLQEGLINIIYGDRKIGNRLSTHPDIDGIIYSGSFEGSQEIRNHIATNVSKKFMVQTGGKNSVVVLDDADLDEAIYQAAYGMLFSAGQRFHSSRRLILQSELADQFMEKFIEEIKRVKVGPVNNEKHVFYGPLCCKEAVRQFQRFQGIAGRESLETFRWGKEIDNDAEAYIVSPGVHLMEWNNNKKNVYENTVFFGPDVAVYIVDSLDEAINQVNDSVFCLSASLFSKSTSSFEQFIRHVNATSILWNHPTTHINYELPFGGRNKAGNGPSAGAYIIYACSVEVSYQKKKSGLTNADKLVQLY